MQLWNLQSNEKTRAKRKLKGSTPEGSDPKDSPTTTTTTLYLTLVYIFGTRSTQEQVRAAGGKRVGIKTPRSRRLLTFKRQEIVLKLKSVRMIRPDLMSRGGRLFHSPTAGVARLETV